SNLWGDATDLAPVMKRLYAVFDWRLWWTDASGSFNRIVFSAKNIDETMVQPAFSKRAIQLDMLHDLSFSHLVDQLQTAYGKTRADFEAIAASDMQAAESSLRHVTLT